MKASKSKAKELEFKSSAQLEDSLKASSLMNEFPEEMLEEISEMLVEQLNRKYRDVAREKYNASLASSLLNKRRTHGDLTEKVNSVFTTIRLGEKGILEFSKEEHRTSLSKYLLKTQCTDIINEMFQYVAEENMVKVDHDKELTLETRVKIINELPKEISEAGLKLHKSLAGGSVTDFLTTLETHIGVFCDVMLKKQDKKKDRQILFGHRQSLLEQVQSSTDPALTLHVAVLAVFYHVNGCMLHASGKFVPIIIEHLEMLGDALAPDQLSLLQEQQKLIISSLSKSLSDEEKSEILSDLESKSGNIKTLVQSLKKSSPSDKD